ncbi:hypothetical protein MicB006_4600 [Micromonospora sp. B006]|nr:hypothetical protein MicB006_4600 [Micromonospora sp. B006]
MPSRGAPLMSSGRVRCVARATRSGAYRRAGPGRTRVGDRP